MEIKDWTELKSSLCKTLEEISQRKTYDRAEIDVIDKITHSINTIEKIEERKMGGYEGMSSGYYPRMWSAEGSYGRMMPDYGDSYGDRSGMHYVRGHYSRGNEMDNSRMDSSRMDSGRMNY